MYNIIMRIEIRYIKQEGDSMEKNIFVLTKNELEIMLLMWEQARPLARSEVINLSTTRSWKASSIHILLNQLLEKGAIVIDGFVRTGKNYGRTYSVAITREEYQIMQLKHSAGLAQLNPSMMVNIILALMKDSDFDEAALDTLEAVLQEKRAHLKK